MLLFLAATDEEEADIIVHRRGLLPGYQLRYRSPNTPQAVGRQELETMMQIYRGTIIPYQ